MADIDIVRFKDEQYGVRRGSFPYQWLDLESAVWSNSAIVLKGVLKGTYKQCCDALTRYHATTPDYGVPLTHDEMMSLDVELTRKEKEG